MRTTKKGIWSLIDSFYSLQVLLETDIDYVILDLEHGQWQKNQLEVATTLCRHAGKKSVIRIPNLNQEYFQASQDALADFIQIAGIHSQDDIDEIEKRISRYPQGNLGFSPWTQAGRAPSQGIAIKSRITIQIENVDLIKKFNSGNLYLGSSVFSVFIGRYDLSVSMNLNGHINHPELMAHVAEACLKSRDLGIPIGSVSNSKLDFDNLCETGMDFISLGSDVQKLINPIL